MLAQYTDKVSCTPCQPVAIQVRERRHIYAVNNSIYKYEQTGNHKPNHITIADL